MNDIELLGQHASRLRAQLEQLDTRVGADARAQERQRRTLLELEQRLSDLPAEISNARGAAETASREAARLAAELQIAQDQAGAARDRAQQLDDELAGVHDAIAAARSLLESIGLKSTGPIQERQRVADELARVQKRLEELTDQMDAAEQARIDALVKGQ